MKRLLLSLGLILSLGFGLSSSVSAHVLKQNNGVAAVLHIPPFDAPVTKQLQQLQFEFGTNTGSFQISDYKVKVAVSDGRKIIQTQAVTAPHLGANAEGDATVNFPRPAVYDLHLSGVSIDSARPNFDMTFQVRVTGAAQASSANGGEILLIGAASLIILVMITIRQVVTGGRYAAASKRRTK